MTVQPPGLEPQETPPPPIERRASDRRTGQMRRSEDRMQLLRTGVVAATSVAGGLAVLFLFFALIGTIDFKDAIGSVIAAAVLALVWVAGYLYRHRREPPSYVRHERERRGF
jgi:hypothetical protein